MRKINLNIMSVDDEIWYGKALKANALAMGQKGRLPPTMELNKINKVNSIQEKCLAFFEKSEKPITAYALQEAMGIKEVRNARNYIQRLVRHGHIKRVNNSSNIVFAEYILK